VLAALLAASLCAPAAARAGCDHRPFLGDGAGEISLPADRALAQKQAAERGPPATPCRGPGCSRGPSQPPATPPAPREWKPSWAFLPESPPVEAGPGARLCPLPSPSPVRHAASIFHPPRPSLVVASL
jgi:hypothetical protein